MAKVIKFKLYLILRTDGNNKNNFHSIILIPDGRTSY